MVTGTYKHTYLPCIYVNNKQETNEKLEQVKL